LDTGGITNDLGGAGVKDCFSFFHWSLSVYGDPFKGCLPVTLSGKVLALTLYYGYFDVADHSGNGQPGESTRIKGIVYTTKIELRAGVSQLEGKDGTSHCIFGDKSLEHWRCMIDRYRLETHAHQAISRELASFKLSGIVGCNTESLRARLRQGR
jgi:hypothetical protein